VTQSVSHWALNFATQESGAKFFFFFFFFAPPAPAEKGEGNQQSQNPHYCLLRSCTGFVWREATFQGGSMS
jgi:hypothetical protein